MLDLSLALLDASRMLEASRMLDLSLALLDASRMLEASRMLDLSLALLDAYSVISAFSTYASTSLDRHEISTHEAPE
jgi:hypothetical protein